MTDGKIFYMSSAQIGRYNPNTGEYEDVGTIPSFEGGGFVSADSSFAVLHRDDVISNAELPDVFYTDASGNVNITITVNAPRRRGRNIHPQFYRTMAALGLWQPLIQRSLQRKKHRKAMRRKRQ